MSKKQTALSTIPSHDIYVLKSSNNSRVKIMVSQKTWGDQVWTSEISKETLENSRTPLASKKKGGNYRMASYTS